MNRNYLSRKMFFPLIRSLLLFSVISSFFISRVARYPLPLTPSSQRPADEKWKLRGSLKIPVFITSEHLLHKKKRVHSESALS